MASSSSDGSRKRPRADSVTDDDASRTKRAVSMDKPLNNVDAIPATLNADLEIDEYMSQQQTSPDDQAPSGHDPSPPPASPPSMSRVQTVPVKEKWDAIGKLKYTSMKEGDVWYLISAPWIKKWRERCNPNQYRGDDSSLGPVDNSTLVDDHGALLPKLTDEENYEIICKEAWDLFTTWYGTPTYELPRVVIEEGHNKAKRVEVYPLKLYVFRMSAMTPAVSNKETPTIELSKSAKVEDVVDQVVTLSTLDRSDLRFWQVIGSSLEETPLEGTFYPSDRIQQDNAQPFPKPEYAGKRLDESLVENGDAIVFEYRSQGTWTVDIANVTQTAIRTAPIAPNAPKFFDPNSDEFKAKYQSGTHSAIKPMSSGSSAVQSSSASFQSPASSSFTFNGRMTYSSPPRAPGTIGLNNLGNTCFMNSALQCLAHDPELNEYFLSGVFQDELNPTNPLGMKGAIAEVFGSLLDKIWHPVSNTFAPREFKQQLQRFAPQFSGYAQHDTQEFLAFLLDGLHEDLNRVLKKPYVEIPDWNGESDKDLVQHAITAWEGYKKRNDSVIVDLFQGQYKSTLVCPECNKISITFDPFMYLTLPLPVQRVWEHIIYWVPYDTIKPRLEIPIQVPRDGCIKDLKLLMKKWFGTPIENQICIETFSHKVYKDFDDHTPLGDITERDMVVIYELPCPAIPPTTPAEGQQAFIPVPVYHAKAGHRMTYHDLFGIPFYVAIPLKDASDEAAIYAHLVDRYVPWTNQPAQLYKRTVRMGATTQDTPNTPPPEEEAADQMEEQDVTEMTLDANEDHDMEQTSADGPSTSEEIILGPQDNLFSIKLYPPSRTVSYGYSNFMHDPMRNTAETLAERAAQPKKKKLTSFITRTRTPTPEPDAQSTSKPLISRDDTILCEWDRNLQEFYFEPGSKTYNSQEKSLWETWQLYEHPDIIKAMKTRAATKERGITLEDCLDEFTKEERLGEDDLWYCPRCKKHQQATKKFELWKVPDVLVVHLKRFSNSRLLRDKIDSLVDFPTEGLDLSPRVEERLVIKKWEEAGNDPAELGVDNNSTTEPLLYDLFAVDEHMGGLGGGHYRAYAKNFEDNTWYHFDDTHVSASSARSSINSNAYLLFYRRRSDKPLGGSLKEKIAAHREKLASAGPDMEVESAQAPKPLEPEYSSHYVPSRSPDHSSPEHHEFFKELSGIEAGPPDLELTSLTNSPPNFSSALEDRLLETSTYPMVYKAFKVGSGSSSNEAVSPTSSYDDNNRFMTYPHTFSGGDDDIPDLEDVDPIYGPHQNIRLDDIDSDHLDDDPPFDPVKVSSEATSPVPSLTSASAARETAPSPDEPSVAS